MYKKENNVILYIGYYFKDEVKFYDEDYKNR